MLGLIKKLFSKSPATDYKQLVKEGAIILDVRTVGEFRSGHIKGALNIPLDQVSKKLNELKKKNKPVITCCQSGGRSGVAKRMIQSAGIECYNGGAWSMLNRKIA